MKKYFLLSLATLCMLVAHGQNTDHARQNCLQPSMERYNSGNTTGAKTTSLMQRWFNFGYYEDTALGGHLGMPGSNVGSMNSFLWFTDSAKFYNGISYTVNDIVSVGQVFDPAAPCFSDSAIFDTSLLAITSSNSYIIDSFEFAGQYHRNHSKHTVVDTIRLSFTYGPPVPGGANVVRDSMWGYASTYGTDTVVYATLYFDTLRKHACNITGGSTLIYTQDVFLREIDTALGQKDTVIKLNTAITVPAGSVFGATLTFKSGDTSVHPSFTDTVARAGNNYDYGAFSPYFIYNNTGGVWHYPDIFTTTPAVRWNAGLLQVEPVTGGTGQREYFPSFDVVDPPGTTSLLAQYPWFGFHALCTGGHSIGYYLRPASLDIAESSGADEIRLYPNPAGSELNIATPPALHAVEACIVNMMGQVVARACLERSRATINISSLSPSIYLVKIDGACVRRFVKD